MAYSTVSATISLATMSFYIVYAAEKKPIETRTSSFYFTCRIQMRQRSLAPTLPSWKRTTLFARIMAARPPGRSGLRCFNNSIRLNFSSSSKLHGLRMAGRTDN